MNSFVEITEFPLLTRKALAEELTRRGYRISPYTLATMAVRGGGPPYRKWSNRPLYDLVAAVAWAEHRLSKLIASTSELTAAATKDETEATPERDATPCRSV